MHTPRYSLGMRRSGPALPRADPSRAHGLVSGRIEVFLYGEVRVFHRPHPGPDTDKGAVANIRDWLKEHEVAP